MVDPRQQTHRYSERRTAIDPERLAKQSRGEADLVEALGLTVAERTALRTRARALFAAGRYEQSLRVMAGLLGLNDIRPEDPVLVSECHRALGDDARAEAWLDEARGLFALWSHAVEVSS